MLRLTALWKVLFLKRNEIVRLDKFLSSQLNISRSDSKKLLKKKCVTVNGSVVVASDMSIDASSDVVAVHGEKIEYNRYYYIMLNKPKGVVSATNDINDVTVIDILPEEMKRNGLFPAGRLDKDTTGFVLITDNGGFAHDILSPSHHVKKTYYVDVTEMLSDDDIKRFLDGMMIGDELFKPAELRFLQKADNGLFRYEIKIVEGRYHQIKRMFASVGHPVIELFRFAIGQLEIDSSLLPGEARFITADELKLIKS